MKNKTEKLTHPFGAEFDAYSKILILGTFPSVKSRENMFYYGNPRNRFFKVLSALFNEAVRTPPLSSPCLMIFLRFFARRI
ncbi:MAG: hypothetical protein RSA41_08300, partial [Christensenella sp.]